MDVGAEMERNISGKKNMKDTGFINKNGWTKHS